MASGAEGMEGQKERRRLVLGALLVLAAGALINGLLLGRHVYVLWRHGMRLSELAQHPSTVLESNGPAMLKADLAAMEGALEGLQAPVRGILGSAWLPWPAGRDNLRAVALLSRLPAELAHVGLSGADALQSVVEALDARAEVAEGQKPPGMSEALFSGLVGAQPHFSEMERQVAVIHRGVAGLNTDGLWSPLSTAVPLLERYLEWGQAALKAAAAAPTLLGDGDPVHYLILPQNSDELRATGGFLTGIGLLSLEGGKISQLTIKDSYAWDSFTVDHPLAPEPMQRYMGIILWVTRDGNWSPDFPTSARAIEDLYNLENEPAPDGLVAFDMFAVRDIVAAIGPLYLEEYGDQVDGSNVLQKMREYWQPSFTEEISREELAQMSREEQRELFQKWWLHRKDFMGVLAQEFMGRLQGGMKGEDMAKLLRAVGRAVQEKHIQLYFHEPAVQELLAVVGLDATVDRSTQGDYLLALDTNMGYNKVNLNVQKRMQYEVTLGPGPAARATLSITYNNRSPDQSGCEHRPKWASTYDGMAQDCYWNYLRVYTPPGSQLLASEGFTETEMLSEEGKTLFAGFLIVPAGRSRVVRFHYALPDWDGREYRLLVQKQAGTEAVPIRVRVSLPPGAEVEWAQPQPQAQEGGVLSYELDLRRDRQLVVKLR